MRKERNQVCHIENSGCLNTDSGKPAKVFKSYQNQCSRLTRMGVQELPELVFKLCQNTQAVLYSTSFERELAVRQSLVGAEEWCKKMVEKGKPPVVHVQLEGVLADTSSYVADLIAQGRYADQESLQTGALIEWFDYGLAEPDEHVVAFLRNVRNKYKGKVEYTVTVEGAEVQNYCQMVCRWLMHNDIDDEPVINTGLCIINTEGSESLSLLTRQSAAIPEEEADGVYLIPAPHQLWEWWRGDGSNHRVVEQLFPKIKRWVMPQEGAAETHK